MRTINFYAFIEGLEFSFSQDEVGERKTKLLIHCDKGIAYPESFDLDNDEEAKDFLHHVIDGFFEKKNKQTETKNDNAT